MDVCNKVKASFRMHLYYYNTGHCNRNGDMLKKSLESLLDYCKEAINLSIKQYDEYPNEKTAKRKEK